MNNAIPQIQARHCSENRRVAGVAAAFIIRKEKQPVLYYRPSNRCAEHVSDQLWTWHCGVNRIVEPVVCLKQRIAIEFISRAMKLVRAALSNQTDLSAAGTPLFRVGIRGHDPEFLN